MSVLRMTLAVLLASASLSTGAHAVETLEYRVTGKKPQERRNFIQGLEILDGKLYVSSGNYGQSRLMRYSFNDMTLEVSKQLHHRLFAEGLTVLNERVYQLTWRARMMLVFDQQSLDALEWFPISGQGWGLTNDGKQLIYSDGSDRLHFMSPTERTISRSLSVTEDGKPVYKLNELEWIEGRVWANIWQSDRIVIINPDSGDVEASLDLQGLLPTSDRRADTNVLNGIARDPADGSIWVTGKRWPWLYHIEIQPGE
ncbi:glutaminyl-peptide cyclotransferase [Seongchinamella unica]|uniref:Glutaminyl-peptide cyclotransferase n=1 Tax=Seongchinamella unica TaxID=2547392 RepID=A0A4R5LT81_9GAMM|nr:glutaminyl-peptide cyclotransferase [Seongchinamella unica]TDG14155.1 glutaminyl-peptide cyclotransferase [Seongchinamella unica]